MSLFQFKKAKLIQISTGCLSHFSYMLFSGNKAAIIDPLRHSEPYLKLLKEHDADLKHIFLTHIHADFISGHLPLQRKTNAKIIMGPGAQVAYNFYEGKNNEDFVLEDINLRLMHTPGHTLESICLLLQEELKNDALFTGDTLFLGDSGRPDLCNIDGTTPEKMAERLFYSLKNIKKLEDNVMVFPTHGAGSPCGKNIQNGSYCTIGKQKEINPAMNIDDLDSFIKYVTFEIDPPPAYFSKVVEINKSNTTEDSDEILKRSLEPLSSDFVKRKIDDTNCIILDTRPNDQYIKGHIKNSVSIPLMTKFALFAGYVCKNQNIIIIAEPKKETEAILRLSRIGIDNVIGFLKGGMDSWNEAKLVNESIDAREFLEFKADFDKNTDKKMGIIDVRSVIEYGGGHVDGSVNIPLPTFVDHLIDLDKRKTYYVMCASGIRSTVAQTMAKKSGYNFININGGFGQIQKEKERIAKV